MYIYILHSRLHSQQRVLLNFFFRARIFICIILYIVTRKVKLYDSVHARFAIEKRFSNLFGISQDECTPASTS